MSHSAIDFHLHVQPWDTLKPEVRASWRKTQRNFPELERLMRDPKRFLAMLDAAGVEKACLVNYPSPDVMGFDDAVNDFVANYCKAAPERLIPVGGIHPRLSRNPKGEMKHLLEDLGIRMVKIHGPHQGVMPNAYLEGNEILPVIYEACQAARIPLMFHTGTSIFPGARSRFGDPLGVEDVAVDFPGLTLILAHAGRPFWTEQAVFLARRFPNVHLDLSSIPPKSVLRFLPRLEELADKALFGTDWPAPGVPGIAENLKAFRELPLPAAALRKILHDNAAAILSGRAAGKAA